MSEWFRGFLFALIFTSFYFGINAWECGRDKKKLRDRIRELEKQKKDVDWERTKEKERLWNKIREYEHTHNIEPFHM